MDDVDVVDGNLSSLEIVLTVLAIHYWQKGLPLPGCALNSTSTYPSQVTSANSSYPAFTFPVSAADSLFDEVVFGC